MRKALFYTCNTDAELKFPNLFRVALNVSEGHEMGGPWKRKAVWVFQDIFVINEKLFVHLAIAQFEFLGDLRFTTTVNYIPLLL